MYTLDRIKAASSKAQLEFAIDPDKPFPKIWYAGAIKEANTPYVISHDSGVELPKPGSKYGIHGYHAASGMVMFDKPGHSMYPWLISLDDLAVHGFYISAIADSMDIKLSDSDLLLI